jgi:CubicO group peptidase (beta-lactamase class C family)
MELRDLDAFIQELVREDKFSGVVLLAKDLVLLSKAYGYANRSFEIPNNLDTKFNLGSIWKVFTGVAAARLVQEGKLSFESTVKEILPEYGLMNGEKITLHHLLTHTSGLAEYMNSKVIQESESFAEISDTMPLICRVELIFEPGEGWSYSSSGYVLVGAIIEKVSGKSYIDFLREKIFKPADMVNTDLFRLDDVVPNLAEGYTKRGNLPEWRKNYRRFLVKGNPAGGGFSTAPDLLNFSKALKTRRILNDEYVEIATTGKVDIPKEPNCQYGYGFREHRYPSFTCYGHNGGWDGISASFWNYDNGYTVIVLSNLDPPSAWTVHDRIQSLVTGHK